MADIVSVHELNSLEELSHDRVHYVFWENGPIIAFHAFDLLLPLLNELAKVHTASVLEDQVRPVDLRILVEVHKSIDYVTVVQLFENRCLVRHSFDFCLVSWLVHLDNHLLGVRASDRATGAHDTG